MRVVITGGTGFIGSNLAKELAAARHEVLTLSRAARGPTSATLHGQHSVDSARAREFASQGDAIVHLAGIADASSSVRLPYAYAYIHSTGTLNMLEAARSCGIPFVLVSSQRVYEPRNEPLREDGPKSPLDPYGYSKLVAEQWVEMYHRLYGVPTVVLRLFSVYGPGQVVVSGTSGVVSIFTGQALAGREMHVRTRVLRDFTYIGDAVQGIGLALTRPPAVGRTYNIATGVGTSLEELARLVRQVTKSSAPVTVEDGRDDDHYVADIARARAELGYEPKVGLEEGLAGYAQWWKTAAKS